MNILFYLDRFPGFGGIEIVTNFLSKEFLEDGNSVYIVSFKQQNLELIDDINLIRIFKMPDQEIMTNRNQDFLTDLILKLKIDLVIHQHSYAPIFNLIVKVRSIVYFKLCTVEHNTPDAKIKMFKNYLNENNFNVNFKIRIKKMFSFFFIWLVFRKEKKRHKSLYQNSDYYFLLSDKYVDIFKKLTNISNLDKLYSIPNPLTIQYFPNKIIKEKIILYIGRLDKYHKRVDRLINIFGQLPSELKSWKLLIVGDGPDRQELEYLAKIKKIENVFFEGFKVDVTSYYLRSAVLCLTSNIEGYPLVLCESMSHGVIPISYDSFLAVNDIIEDKISGFIIPSFDQKKYLQVLTQLLSDQTELDNLSVNCIERSKKFDKQVILSRWKSILNLNNLL